MDKAEMNRLTEAFQKILSKCTTKEIRDLLSEFVLDIPQTAQFLGVSQSRFHKLVANKSIESVVGSNCFLRRDAEKLKDELEKKRKRYGSGWSSSEDNAWVFSQENVLTILIELHKESKTDVSLKDVIHKIDGDMEYSDKSMRVLFAMKKLIAHGAVVKPQRGFYRPTKPDLDVKSQLPVTRDFYIYDAGEFDPEIVYGTLKDMGSADIPVTKLWKKLNVKNEDPKKARFMTRRALDRLIRSNRVKRVSRGKYSIVEE